MSIFFKKKSSPETSLCTAASEGDLEQVRKILESGPYANYRNDDSCVPLHCAVEFIKKLDRCLEVCKCLLENQADPKIWNNLGETPLHYIWNRKPPAEPDDGRLLKLLIEYGADVNLSRGWADIPLLKAVKKNDYDGVQRLLQLGANIVRGNFILTTAIKNCNERMILLLLSYNADICDPFVLFTAAKTDAIPILQILFYCGSDFSKYKSKDYYYYPNASELFHDITMKHQTLVVDLFLENRIDLCIQNLQEVTYNIFCEFTNLISRGKENQAINSKRMFMILLRHISVLQECGVITLNDSISKIIRVNFYTKAIYERYQKQIREMKNLNICENSKLTYFDLLTRRGKSLSLICDERTRVPEITIRHFPDFRLRLRRNFYKGLFEKQTRDRLHKLLHDAFNGRLPFELVCTIGDYLKMSDLMAFRLRQTQN